MRASISTRHSSRNLHVTGTSCLISHAGFPACKKLRTRCPPDESGRTPELRRWISETLLFRLSERQKFFARDLPVLNLVNSHLRHLHPLFRGFVGHIDIELHNERVAGYKWSADFCAVHLETVLKPLRLTAHLINAAHFSRHVLHLSGLHAYDVFRVEIIDCLHPFAFTAILHQLCCDFFCTHLSSFRFGWS